MILSEAELAELLGVTAEEVAKGATWLLPARGGARLRASIIRETDEGNITVQVSEEIPGEGDSQVAWLSGSAVDDAGRFEVTGYDLTGEFSDNTDPRIVATVIRRQIDTIRHADDGHRVA
ncbi:hypothetical protein ACVIGB_000383 [Bradyrhizobium sp. USDA 4341]